MASWRDLKAYVRSRYRVIQDHDEAMQLELKTEADRTQFVYLWHRRVSKREDWLVIGSPFADVDQVDLHWVLETVGRMAVGGVVMVGQHLAIRHAVPLDNMDSNEFERPLHLVTRAADHLEHKILGEDHY